MVPATSADVLVSDINRLFVRQWLAAFATARPARALALIGPTGCGMSTLAELCLREAGRDVVRLDASTYTGRKGLRQTLATLLTLPIRRAVLVEEPEAMVADGGLSEVVAFVRANAAHRKAVPVVAVCNKHKRPKLGALLQAAERVEFSYMSRPVLLRHFARCRPELRGDLRQLSADNRLSEVSVPDRFADVTDATAAALAGDGALEERGLAYPSDWPSIVNLVQENYASGGADIASLAAAADSISAGELLLAAGETEAAYYTGALLPGALVRTRPKKLATDKVWTNYATTLSRQRALRQARLLFQAGGATLDLDSLELLQAGLFALAREERWDGVWGWLPDPDAAVDALAAVLRLGRRADKQLLGRIRRAAKRAPPQCSRA